VHKVLLKDLSSKMWILAGYVLGKHKVERICFFGSCCTVSIILSSRENGCVFVVKKAPKGGGKSATLLGWSIGGIPYEL